MSSSLQNQLTSIVSQAFAAAGYSKQDGVVVLSQRPDICQFQANGAFTVGSRLKKDPLDVAKVVAKQLTNKHIFSKVEAVAPGFINLTLNDKMLAQYAQDMLMHPSLGIDQDASPQIIIIDYGGANIAKPMHVGHLRSSVIGESLKLLARFLGHHVIGDIHLGDWGIQMGMVITELQLKMPDLPHFNPTFKGPYPDPPLSVDDLDKLYPLASKRCKESLSDMDAARQATVALQNGEPGYRALWEYITNISKKALRADYEKLGIEFDLWLGESDTQPYLYDLIEQLRKKPFVKKSEGALIIPIEEKQDKRTMPPFMLLKSDGAVLYGTTDLATIQLRVKNNHPDFIWYVVDARQSQYFQQLFRAAYKTQIAPMSLVLEHIPFGTVNGQDGRPFKTREGGAMKLKDLIDLVIQKASEKMAQNHVADNYPSSEKTAIAHKVGLSALKFGDLVNNRTQDYIFDIDRLCAFEGKTGPYILYTIVRAKSIIKKTTILVDQLIILPPKTKNERDLLILFGQLPDILHLAYEKRTPHDICEYAYNLACVYNRFYTEHHILTEKNSQLQHSRLALTQLCIKILELTFSLLGIHIPDRM